MSRWMYTLHVIILLPNALLLAAMSSWKGTVRNVVLSLLVVCSLVLMPLWTPSALRATTTAAEKEYDKRYKSVLIEMLSFLESQDKTTEREIVLANIFIGPAIMYHTSFDVVGTANHSNEEGILDTYRILNAEDDSIANALIERRGIDFLLVDDDLKRFAEPRLDGSVQSEGSPVKDVFLDRLIEGRTGDWLYKVALPESLGDTFQLYRVVGTPDGNAG